MEERLLPTTFNMQMEQLRLRPAHVHAKEKGALAKLAVQIVILRVTVPETVQELFVNNPRLYPINLVRIGRVYFAC